MALAYNFNYMANFTDVLENLHIVDRPGCWYIYVDNEDRFNDIYVVLLPIIRSCITKRKHKSVLRSIDGNKKRK